MMAATSSAADHSRQVRHVHFLQLASGASHLVVIGAHRDSTHEAVTSNPGAFGTTPLAVPQISPRPAAYSSLASPFRRFFAFASGAGCISMTVLVSSLMSGSRIRG
jgi:hypothetical protein